MAWWLALALFARLSSAQAGEAAAPLLQPVPAARPSSAGSSCPISIEYAVK